MYNKIYKDKEMTDGHTIAGMVVLGYWGAVLDNKFPGVTLYKL